MKRFTSALALCAFVAALTAPLAFAQGGAAPATDSKPAAAAPATDAAAKTTVKHKSHAMSAKAGAAKVEMTDINSASKEDLMKVNGVDDATADKIIAGRPYKMKSQLVTKKIVDKATYAKLKGSVVAKKAAAAPAASK